MRKSLALISLCATVISTVSADEKDWKDQPLEDRASEHCISINRIDRTDILDDQTIIFYMRGREHYLNKMKNRCPSLAFEDAFLYSTPLGQLCSIDTITVLRRSGGNGFIQGPSCGLDAFIPITRDEAKSLTKDAIDAKKSKREKKKNEKEDN